MPTHLEVQVKSAYRLASLVGLTLITSGCDTLTQGCDLLGIPGLVVSVVDAGSGDPVPVEASAVSATDGDYTEYPDGPAAHTGWSIFLENRPGVYRVEVSTPGYEPWVEEGVRVESGRCGIMTTRVTARMQPSG
jgi:hypothetical protein